MSDNGAFEVETIELTQAGRVRRDRMLADLQTVMVGRRRRRKLARATVLAAALLLVGLTLWRAFSPAREDASRPSNAPIAEAPPNPASGATTPLVFEHMQFERVGVDPSVLQRFACDSRSSA